MPMPMTADRHCPSCGLQTDAEHCPQDGTTTLVKTGFARDALSYKAGDLVAARYRITGVLGRGGFGAVYAAEHTGTRQAIALKMLALNPATTADDVVKRFFREAQITASLSHANTVRVFDVGQDDSGTLFIAMELLRGRGLDTLLRKLDDQGRTMTEVQAVDIALPVLKSLAEAHRAQLVHRDLKPGNIMLADQGGDMVVKVLDFGIARSQDSSLTGAGKALGTPAYMSPEQVRGRALDGRSDLYALGVILFRCVTGKLPFDSPDPMAIMFMHANEPPPDPRTLTSQRLSDGFVHVVLQALAKSPDDRFADARAMRLALEVVRGGAWAGTPMPAAPVAEGGDGPTLQFGPAGRPPAASAPSSPGTAVLDSTVGEETRQSSTADAERPSDAEPLATLFFDELGPEIRTPSRAAGSISGVRQTVARTGASRQVPAVEPVQAESARPSRRNAPMLAGAAALAAVLAAVGAWAAGLFGAPGAQVETPISPPAVAAELATEPTAAPAEAAGTSAGPAAAVAGPAYGATPPPAVDPAEAERARQRELAAAAAQQAATEGPLDQRLAQARLAASLEPDNVLYRKLLVDLEEEQAQARRPKVKPKARGVSRVEAPPPPPPPPAAKPVQIAPKILE